MKRILWVTNIMLLPICEAMNKSVPVIGGWMYSSLRELQKVGGLEFAVATVWQGKEFVDKRIGGTRYFLLPLGGKNNEVYQPLLEIHWKKIQQEFLPDVIHIHGTEFAHGLAYLRACGAKGVVVSIQGLVSVYARYYLGGISVKEVLKHITFRDIVKRGNFLQQQQKFYRRGFLEKELIRSVGHIIGRTSWDKAHVWAINPDVRYHFCNETLRGEFYKHQWRYEECEKHSIFLSQAGYPIKGLHQVLKALPYVLREFPDVKLYVGGQDIRGKKTWKERLKRTGYGQYINRLIRKLSLENHVVFTGFLNEAEMCQRYLKSNVFVCPSSIENSPNSLGEAQLLGMPCVAAYAGGIPDMMRGYKRGEMYRFEEVEMLANLINEYFQKTWDEKEYLVNQVAYSRHNAEDNAQALLKIYETVIK